MVELTGEFSEEVQECFQNLKVGIHVGNRVITEAHNFEEKLISIEIVMGHIEFEYQEVTEIYEFFSDIILALTNLREKLEELEKGELHIVRKEEKETEKGAKWVAKHIKKVEGQLDDEEELLEETLKEIRDVLKELRQRFIDCVHLFDVYEEKTIKKVKAELEDKEEEIKHISQNLFDFISHYARVFQTLLDELKEENEVKI